MNKEELLNLIESIKIDSNEFTLLSTAALVLRGIRDNAKDLDIAVTQKGLDELMKNYPLKKKNDEWYIVTDKVECILDDMVGKKEMIGKYYLQDIHDYLAFLESSDRQKDKDKIPVVKEYIVARKK